MTFGSRKSAACPKTSKVLSGNIDWEDEANVATLSRLWSEGLSTAKIAARMGCTKNAIIGKAHRLNLPKRDNPIRRHPDGYVPKPQPPKRVRAGTPTLPQLSIASDQAPVITQVQPRAQFCCWPIGEPGKPSFHFCNESSVPGKPYCQDHTAIAYVRVLDRRREDAT